MALLCIFLQLLFNCSDLSSDCCCVGIRLAVLVSTGKCSAANRFVCALFDLV